MTKPSPSPELTFYQQEVNRIREKELPDAYVVERIIRAKNFIDAHFLDDIDLDTVARSAYLSKYHFIRSFRICYGKTPYQYLTEKRIQKAEDLLIEGKTVPEICVHLGFSSVPSFTHYFKKYFGTTPGQFRKKAISDK